MRQALFVASFMIATLALPSHHQQCEAEDHQLASANIKEQTVPASVASSTPSLPPTGPNTDQSHHDTWNYSDGFAPPTWNGWALAILAGIAAWIALFTLSAIKKQVAAEQASVELMRTEYAATHRPRMRIRNVDIDLGEIDPSNASKLCQTKVGFQVVNYGESEAVPTNAQYSIIMGGGGMLPITPNYESEFISNMRRAALSPGVGVRVVVTGKQYPLLAVLQSNHPLFIIGYVDYRGTTGVIYRTAFARRFQPQGRFFEKVQNPDYEYEE
jgi:hypothetical protein